MSAAMFTLQRSSDPSGVSGTGQVGTVCEFDSGLTVLHWDTATPSIAVYTDSRHIEQLHGHEGATVLVPLETRLESAYKRVVPLLLRRRYDDRPITVAPHPDHLDRLRVTFENGRQWSFWVALLDGSTYAASHSEVNGEMQHTWVSPDGDLWLQYWTPIPNDSEGPLAIFDKEDR